MNILANEIYHIYNQGNNKETIFLSDENYSTFLKMFRKFVSPHCKVLAWCLMPNHFHFEIYATTDAATIIKVGNINCCMLSNGFRLLQSNYAQYFNKKYERTGSLFRQKAKAKSMSEGSNDAAFIAFHYIHQNPLKAGLVKNIEKWPYSSFPDFAGLRKGTLCDQELAEQLIGGIKKDFASPAYTLIDEELSKKIFLAEDMI